MRKYSDWLKEVGVSEVTGWRWEKNGAVNVQRIGTRKFITEAEITRIGAKAGQAGKVSLPVFQPLAPWLRSIGVSQRTGLRWEKAGVIAVVRIRGRKYVTLESVARVSAPVQEAA